MLTQAEEDFRRRNWLIMLAGLAIAYSPQYINPVLRSLGVSWSFIQGPPSVLLWNWLAVAALFVLILRVERTTLASIGLRRPTWQDVQWGAIFWGLSSLISTGIQAIYPLPPSAGLDLLLALPIPVLIALILTTSISEEILFRGYPIERLRVLTGHIWLGVLASFTLFVLPHLIFFGPQWLLYQGVGAVLFYVLYLWRRSLMACIVMHLLGNSLLLIPALTT